MEIATILTLLPPIYGDYHELQVINRLTNHFHFDHHILLLDPSADADRFIHRNGFTPHTICVSTNADKVRVSLLKEKSLPNKNVFMIAVPGRSEFDQNLMLLSGMKQIQGLHVKVGVFFAQDISNDELHKFFNWCKENLIVNIFLATTCSSVQNASLSTSLNIYPFNPFGAFDPATQIIASSETFDDWFPSEKSNFHQHELRFGRPNKFPLYVSSTDANIWRAVLDLMNASFVEVEHTFSNISEGFQNGIDVFPSLFVQKDLNDLRVETLGLSRNTIMVPEALPYSEFSAYLRNAASGEIFAYFFISIAASILTLVVVHYTNKKEVLFFPNAANVLNLLMNDNGYIKYQQLYRSEVFVVLPLTFVGFFVVNCILSNLQSHLTKPILQHQIETIEEIYNSPFPLFAYDQAFKDEIEEQFSRRSPYKDWAYKVIADVDAYENYIYLFNRTLSFFDGMHSASILLKMQKRLNIKGYYDTHIRISSTPFSYQVNERFLFFERLNEIIGWIKVAGLHDLWVQRDFAGYERRILEKNLIRLRDQGEKKFKSIEFPMLIVYGWFAGFVVLMLEIIWKNNEHRLE